MFEEANVKPEKDSRIIAVVCCLSTYFFIPCAIPLLIYVLTKDRYVRFFALQSAFGCLTSLIFLFFVGIALLIVAAVVPDVTVRPVLPAIALILFFAVGAGYLVGPVIFGLPAAIGKPIKFPIIGNFAEKWC